MTRGPAEKAPRTLLTPEGDHATARELEAVIGLVRGTAAAPCQRRPQRASPRHFGAAGRRCRGRTRPGSSRWPLGELPRSGHAVGRELGEVLRLGPRPRLPATPWRVSRPARPPTAAATAKVIRPATSTMWATRKLHSGWVYGKSEDRTPTPVASRAGRSPPGKPTMTTATRAHSNAPASPSEERSGTSAVVTSTARLRPAPRRRPAAAWEARRALAAGTVLGVARRAAVPCAEAPVRPKAGGSPWHS